MRSANAQETALQAIPARADAARRRLQALGAGYLRFTTAEPGLFRLIFGPRGRWPAEAAGPHHVKAVQVRNRSPRPGRPSRAGWLPGPLAWPTPPWTARHGAQAQSGLFTWRCAGCGEMVAVLSALAAARTSHLAPGAQPTASALTAGFHLAFLVAAILEVAAAVAAAAVPARTPVPTPARPPNQ